MHINSDQQDLPLPTSISSGDDHLLTALAENERSKVSQVDQCHDNQAFQFHNNNLLPRTIGSGKSKTDDSLTADALEVVIVHGSGAAAANGRIRGRQSSPNACCRRHAARKRHNATQTAHGSCCCSNDCLPHGELEMSCHCHITHHHHCHHHYSPTTAAAESTKRRAAEHQRHHQHHHHQQHHHRSQQRRHQHRHHTHAGGRCPQKSASATLALNSNNNNNKNNKSSLDSSEDQLHQREQLHLQTIAIEIDAATLTENNTSTATSNFPYKVASEGDAVAPIILSPLRERHRQRRRGSLNSNTTIETDELSHDDDDDVHLGRQDSDADDDEAQLTPRRRRQPPPTSSSSTARALAGAQPHNECVRIKRKRFMPDAMHDYCSSCSRCSSCSCGQQRTSSCSSVDELGDDMHAHELTVAAECHRCNLPDDEPSNGVTLANSRRSSGSFGSCHTSSCCCCSSTGEDYAADGDYDDDDEDETTGQRESFCTAVDHTIVSTTATADGDDAHSSTLTPLTTRHSSLLEDNAEHTMRSDNAAGTDADASSLSQSAEYFSLSSTADKQQSASKCSAADQQPAALCSKHWSKHHRHKRSNSPLNPQL